MLRKALTGIVAAAVLVATPTAATTARTLPPSLADDRTLLR